MQILNHATAGIKIFLFFFKSLKRSSTIVHGFRINSLTDEGTLSQKYAIPMDCTGSNSPESALNCSSSIVLFKTRRKTRCNGQTKELIFFHCARVLNNTSIEFHSFLRAPSEQNEQKVNNNWIMGKEVRMRAHQSDHYVMRNITFVLLWEILDGYEWNRYVYSATREIIIIITTSDTNDNNNLVPWIKPGDTNWNILNYISR